MGANLDEALYQQIHNMAGLACHMLVQAALDIQVVRRKRDAGKHITKGELEARDSAIEWLVYDHQLGAMSLALCCDLINTALDEHGCAIQLNPSDIRACLLAVDDGRIPLNDARFRQYLTLNHRSVMESHHSNVDEWSIALSQRDGRIAEW